MKSQSQTLILIVVLVGLVGGVAFVRNWITTKEEERSPGTTPKQYFLDYPVKVVLGLPEHEINQPGHYDFWFQNPNSHAVEAGVESKYCKCSKVEILFLTPEEATKYRQGYPARATAVLGAMPEPLNALSGVTALAREFQELENPARWQLMTSDDGRSLPVTVPAEAAGFIRLGWTRKSHPGPELLWARIWTQAPGDPRTRSGEGEKLEVPIMLVPPVQVLPAVVQVRDLHPNERSEFEFLCWSATRPAFRLKSAHEESGSPCFVTTITPITAEEFQKAHKAIEPNRPAQMRCGYRVRGTVYERLPDNGPQLDLGPFDRKLLVSTDQEDVQPLADSPPLAVAVRGVVRGEITVGTEESRDKIILKSFPANKGTSMTVPLESRQPALKLKIDSYKPDYLIVHLEDKGDQGGGIKRWDLRVTVPPRPVGGLLPPESAIILKTESQPPRSIRVPVLGRASVSVGGS